MTVKNITFWVAVCLMALSTLYYTIKARNIEPEIIVVRDTVTGTTEKIKEYTDSSGKHTVFYKQDTRTTISDKELLDKDRPKNWADTVANALNIALKEIDRLQRQVSIMESRELQANKTIEDLYKIVWQYRDKYADITFTLPKDSTIKPTFDLSYRNTVTVTDYSRRDRVLGLKIGAKRSYTNITSEDPRTTINGYKTLQIQRREPFFGVRGYASGLYIPDFNFLGLGAGLGVEMGRLTLKGNYLYVPDNNKWYPNFSASYDLIRL